jgi:dihydroorotate dehydrogenase
MLACAARHLEHVGLSEMALVGVGGIANGTQAYARILTGADLIQLYTSLSLKGPYVAHHVLTGLHACLKADGLTSLAKAKGQIKTADAAEAHAEYVSKIASAQRAGS